MTDAAHHGPWRTGDAIFGIPMVIALALQFVVPWSLPLERLRGAAWAVGAALALVGVVLIAAARRAFSEKRQPTDPGHPTTAIVTDGVFAVTRNPIYLGAACVVGGVGIFANRPWIIVALVVSLVGCQRLLIRPEERYLDTKFGEEYRRYATRVRRWFGRRASG